MAINTTASTASNTYFNKTFYDQRIQHGFQERGERTLFRVKREGTGNVFVGNDVWCFHCVLGVIVPLSQPGHVGQWDKLGQFRAP